MGRATGPPPAPVLRDRRRPMSGWGSCPGSTVEMKNGGLPFESPPL
jgi:hypothetical protein